jgi:glycine cleavage system transcriptional repressor
MFHAIRLAGPSARLLSGSALTSASTRRLAAAAATIAPDSFALPRARAVVLSLAGEDAPGIVGRFSRTALAHGANVEETRMARLGGEFAIIGMLTVPAAADVSAVSKAFEDAFPGFSVHCRPTTASGASEEKVAAASAAQVWMVDLEGPDSLGIVAAVTEALATGGANIRGLDTETVNAPFAGYQEFKMRTSFAIAPGGVDKIAAAMAAVEEKFGVSISMSQDEDAAAKDGRVEA